jgi:hypothetical protein
MNAVTLDSHEKKELKLFLKSIVFDCDRILYDKLKIIWKSELVKIKAKLSQQDEEKAPELTTNLVKEKLPFIRKQHEKDERKRRAKLASIVV